jgi:hypothetical protein
MSRVLYHCASGAQQLSYISLVYLDSTLYYILSLTYVNVKGTQLRKNYHVFSYSEKLQDLNP